MIVDFVVDREREFDDDEEKEQHGYFRHLVVDICLARKNVNFFLNHMLKLYKNALKKCVIHVAPGYLHTV